MQSTDFRSIVSPAMMARGGALTLHRRRFDDGGQVDGSDQGGLGGASANTDIGNAGSAIGGALAGSIGPGNAGAAQQGGLLGAENASQGLGPDAVGRGNATASGSSIAPKGIMALMQGVLGLLAPSVAGPLGIAAGLGSLASQAMGGPSLTGYMMEHGTNAAAPNGTMAPGSDAGGVMGALNDAAAASATPSDQTGTAQQAATPQTPSPWLQHALYGTGQTAGTWAPA